MVHVAVAGHYRRTRCGGLLVAAIQLAIMLGAAFGGLLLDPLSLAATWIGRAVMLLLAALTTGRGRRLRPAKDVLM